MPTPPTPDEGHLDADADLVQGRPLPSSKVALNRERVLRTAVDFIDEFGLGQLTMRRLGSALGVEAMALYHHVPSREALLDGVVEVLVADLDHDPEVIRVARHGWEDFLLRLAHGIRRIALAHPNCFPLVASRPPEAPWLRPPLRSLDWVELFLSGLVEQGFTTEQTVAAYRAFTSFLLGHLLLEVSQLGADIGPLDVKEDVLPDDGGSARLRAHPAVMQMRDALSEDHAAAEFEESLESLLDRLESFRGWGTVDET